jgi:hypothetical protein
MNFVPINDIRPFNSYVATEGETTFVFDWFVLKPEYVQVFKNGVLLTYLSQYTIPSNSIGSANGGTIILSNGCSEGDAISIKRKSAIKRTSGYTESGEYRAKAINLDFNYIISLIQEANFLLGRCVVLNDSDPNTQGSLILPYFENRKGKYLAFDNNGSLVAVPGSSIDLYYHWVRVSVDTVLPKEVKKVYAQISSEITLDLPIVGILDDGREIYIINLATNEFNVIVRVTQPGILIENTNPDGVIENAESDELEPREGRTFVYNHALSKWFSIG